jgi:hypothetical protein
VVLSRINRQHDLAGCNMPIEAVMERPAGKQENIYLMEIGLFLLAAGMIVQLGLSLTSGKKEEPLY